jgi:cellobiose phosphorylase
LTCATPARPTRTLAVTAYAEWVLGTSRGATAPYIVTRTDPATGAILAQNTFSTAFPGRIAFADFGAEVTSLTADRAEFIGPGGTLASPGRPSQAHPFRHDRPRPRPLRRLAAPRDPAPGRDGLRSPS